jgi:hypothetical protein
MWVVQQFAYQVRERLTSKIRIGLLHRDDIARCSRLRLHALYFVNINHASIPVDSIRTCARGWSRGSGAADELSMIILHRAN